MIYRVEHCTEYVYEGVAELCHNQAHLLPRDTPRQSCNAARLSIDPAPLDYRERRDFFGNRVVAFTVQQPHQEMTVTARCEVTINEEPSLFESDPGLSWEEARDRLSGEAGEEVLLARLFRHDSPLIVLGEELAAYAAGSFSPGRPLLEAVRDLTARIHGDFEYDPGFTSVATPLAEVLKHRRGVCQDFAHLAVGCLRAQGLAARYVSGYLETIPPPGKKKLVGADASHAWVSVLFPGIGWLDFDPTNNQVVHNGYVTIAWGRDFSDVPPLKGIAYGGGKHQLEVAVDVERIG